MLSKLATTTARGAAARSMPSMATRAMSIELMDTYGKNLFKGKVADEYLSKQGMSWAEMQTGEFTQDLSKADKVSVARIHSSFWRRWLISKGVGPRPPRAAHAASPTLTPHL